MPIPKKQHWLETAIEIYNFHIQQLKEDSTWTIVKTSVVLNRSLGSISNYITIGSWYITNERQLKKFRSMRDALEFIHEHKLQMKLREIE